MEAALAEHDGVLQHEAPGAGLEWEVMRRVAEHRHPRSGVVTRNESVVSDISATIALPTAATCGSQGCTASISTITNPSACAKGDVPFA